MNLWSTVGWCWEYTLKSWKMCDIPDLAMKYDELIFEAHIILRNPSQPGQLISKTIFRSTSGHWAGCWIQPPAEQPFRPSRWKEHITTTERPPAKPNWYITHTRIYIYILLQTITTYTKHRSRYQGKLLAVLERLRLDLPCRQSLGFRPPACSPWAIPINPLAIIWSMAMTQEPIDWRYLRYIRPI